MAGTPENVKKNGTATVSEKEKMFYVFCRKHQEKLEKIGFTEAFIQGSGNFKTFVLSDHEKR